MMLGDTHRMRATVGLCSRATVAAYMFLAAYGKDKVLEAIEENHCVY